MNAEDRLDLRTLFEFQREWRKADEDWKATVERRLTTLENRNIAADAVAVERSKAEDARTKLRERVVGAALTAAGGLAVAVVSALVNGRP